MPVRATSADTYFDLEGSGKLANARAAVLAAIVKYGPATSGEIIRAASDGIRVNDRAVWRARFTELYQRGMIVEVGRRPCGVTGRKAIVWQRSERMEEAEVPPRVTARQLKLWLSEALRLMDLYANKDPDEVRDFMASVKF